jgi:tripartite-type tricarboxylate transporter receptor subunit TctC
MSHRARACQLDFDPLKDVEPVTQLPNNPLLIVARKAVPANNVRELIAWLKANQDKVSVGTSDVGVAHHGRVLLVRHRGRFQFVPYRGAGPAARTASNSLSLPSAALGSISSSAFFPNSPAPSSATSALHPNRIASWPPWRAYNLDKAT